MTKFCTDCGNKLEYKFSPPNFCPNCGAGLGKVESKKEDTKLSQNNSKASRKISEDSEGYTDANFIPNISKLEYELEDFGSDIQHTIGSIGGMSAPVRRKTNIKSLEDL